MDSKHNPFTDLQRCNVRYKMTGTLSMRTSSACLMRWMRRTPCENTSKGQFVGIGSTETYTAQRALLSARRMTFCVGGLAVLCCCSRLFCPRHRQRGHAPRAREGGATGTCMLGSPQDACQPGVGAPTTCRVGRKVGELGTKRKYYSEHPVGGPPSQGAES